MSIAEKLTTIAENEQKVYDAGKSQMNDELWRAITGNGTKTDYDYHFYSSPFTKNNFFPTYKMWPTTAKNMFSYIRPSSEDEQVDMEAWENEVGQILDFSRCSNMMMCFNGGLFKTLHTIDLSSHTSIASGVFMANSSPYKLKRIKRLIFSANTTPDSSWFISADINHIGFEGTLSKNGIDVSSCKALDKESIVSLFNILSSTTSGLSVRLSKTAVNSAFGINIDDATTYPEGSEYYNLRNTKTNWTINYS